MKEKLEKVFDKTINIIFLLLTFWIFILLIFFVKNIDFVPKTIFLISNLIIALIGLLIIVIKKLDIIKFKFKKIDYDKLVKILFIIFFIIQLYVFYHAYFQTGWDSSTVIQNARWIVSGETNRSLSYYSQYPNNLFYTLIATGILKFNQYFGLFSNDYDLISIIFVNCIISSISAYLVYKIGSRLFNKKIAFFGYIISVILFVFSPWNIICYSDSFALFVPILCLYLYMNKKINSYIKYPLIAFLGYLFLSVKPQAIIIVIAIIVVELFKFINKFDKKKIKKVGIVTIITIPLILGTNTLLNKTYSDLNFNLDSNLEISWPHYLMMGANNATNGVYSSEDVVFSKNQPDVKTRNEENIKEFKNRLKQYGVGGYFNLLSRKLLAIYDDGTFAWGGEGNFYKYMKPETTKISKKIRSVYYGDSLPMYSSILQFVWINTLLVIFINSIIMVFKKHKIDYIYLVICLTIIGLTIFELLFEVRARYLYSSLPIFIVLMMYGINNISNLDIKQFKLKKD